MKNILKLFIGLILFVMFSCHNITNSEQETLETNNHAYISISLNGNARTVLPQSADFAKDFELSFELQGQQEGKDLQTIKKWTGTAEKTAYTLMTEDTAVLINTGLWNFELSVQKAGQKVLFGTLEEITIQTGTNTLNFGTLQNITSGNGSVSVALSFPQEGRVQAVQGGLYNLDGTALEGFEKESLTITTSDKSVVRYNKENVPCGTYLVKFELFSDKEASEPMNVYTEIVQVATGFVSAAQRTLEQLNTLYTITYDLSGGEFVEGFSAQASFNQAMTVTLPTAENLLKTGYVFVGWKNDQGDTVTEIPVGTIGDLTLTAQWEEVIRPKITNISLDRIHLDTIMTNRDITVSITGSDFNSLTDLLVQVTDGTTVQLPVAATIDKANNTATATISAPIPSNPTNEGTTYAVKVFANDILEETTATFNVSLPADVTEITLAETSIKLGSSETVNVTVKGTNFDIRGITTIKLFDSNGSEITTSTITVPIEANTSTTEFVAKLPVPRAEDIYTVKIYINNAQDTTAEPTVQVYGDQTITSVTINPATVGEGYTGELSVTIIGENLKGHAITCSDSSFSNVTYLSDTKVTATVNCNGVVGENTITVTSGISSASGTVKVVAAENCFSVGDILFTDGTRIKAENVQYGVPDSQLSKAFAVIASAPYGGVIGKAVGLQRSSSILKWASGTTGYSTNFTGIQGAKTSGDMDGSDNWEYICSIDPEGTKDPATNYPAFNFALTYGTTAELTGTEYENGWYVPSVAELYDIYTHREVVRTSLSAARGFTLGTTSFWSSSQIASSNTAAYRVNLYYGDVSSNHKGNTNYVLVLQAFNAEQFNNYEVTPSVTVATAGEGYTGELPVTIIGKNLKDNEITCSDSSFGNVTYISDTKATATITCSGVVGESTITVTIGASSANCTVKVVESEKCFTVGDIVFTDGTRIKAEDVQYGIPDSQMSKAFAVIASAPYGGAEGKAVGLQKSSSTLEWAPEYTTGYYKEFTEIQAAYSGDSSSGYTFSGDIDGSDNWESICKVDPEGTKDAATNYPVFNFALTYGTQAGLSETEYENGWYVPSVAELYDVYTNKEVVQTSLNVVGGFTLGTGYYRSSSLNASYNTCAYLVYFNNGDVSNGHKFNSYDVFVLQAFNVEQFNNYEVTPSITSVTVATAGECYTGELPVTIIGENLKGHAITSNDASFGNVNYVSDTKVTATFVYDGTNNAITVTSGTSKASCTVKVVAAEKCFTVGDIVFTDGTRIKAEKLQYGIPDSQISKAFAIVTSTAYGGAVGKAVGLQKSSNYLQWAPSNTNGYYKKFTEIQADLSGSSSSGYTFNGDLDGSDNWEYICSIDPEGTKDPANNYPAFNFALTYGTQAGLTGTDYETGWYVPSVTELYDVYTHREVIQTSLNAVGGFTLETSYYWSSSQNASDYDNAYNVYFNNGYVNDDSKNNYNSVFVLQAFNAEQFN